MTVKELYRLFLADLEAIYPAPEAANITSLVFESVAGISRPELIRNPNKLLGEPQLDRLNDALQALRSHKPVQYVLGESWFYNMKLKVTPAVLIPRPETEELAASIIQYLKNKPGLTLLDIGTGSGCIAIAVKKNLERINVTAIDISRGALDIATQNSVQQHAAIELLEMNFLDETAWPTLPVFDVITSNPPYIPVAEMDSMDKNVTGFEPHLALFVENRQPLLFYEKIARFGITHLHAGGKIFMETHEALAKESAGLFNNTWYTSDIVKDLQGKERMLIATRRSP